MENVVEEKQTAQETAVATVEQKDWTTVALEKFEVTNVQLVALANKYAGLKINGVDDREGFNAVRDARLELKQARISIEHKATAIRKSAVAFQKTVIARENELINLIEPTEKELAAEEKRINDEKEAIAKEEERKQVEKFQNRMNALGKLNYAADAYELSVMSDEDYAKLLAVAETEFHAEEERKAEESRIAEERRIANEKAAQEERERLDKVAAEQEAQRQQLEAQARELAVQQEEIRKKAEELATIQRELEAEKQRELDEKFRQEEEERQRVVALGDRRFKILKSYGYEYPDADLGTMPEEHFDTLVEVKRATYEEEQIRIANEKAEADRKERERLEALAREREEAIRPDKEKIENFAAFIGVKIEYPEVNDAEAQRLVSWAKREIENVSAELFKRLDTL